MQRFWGKYQAAIGTSDRTSLGRQAGSQSIASRRVFHHNVVDWLKWPAYRRHPNGDAICEIHEATGLAVWRRGGSGGGTAFGHDRCGSAFRFFLEQASLLVRRFEDVGDAFLSQRTVAKAGE